jgi:hypothetical protein
MLQAPKQQPRRHGRAAGCATASRQRARRLRRRPRRNRGWQSGVQNRGLAWAAAGGTFLAGSDGAGERGDRRVAAGAPPMPRSSSPQPAPLPGNRVNLRAPPRCCLRSDAVVSTTLPLRTIWGTWLRAARVAAFGNRGAVFLAGGTADAAPQKSAILKLRYRIARRLGSLAKPEQTAPARPY